MGVFKDDQLVARVLGGQPLPLKKNYSKIIAIAGCAIAVVALGAWIVIAHKYAAAPNAIAAANPGAAASSRQDSADLPVFSDAPPRADGGKSAPSVKKNLPPVIEEFSVETVELNPKFTVKLIDPKVNPSGRNGPDAAHNSDPSANPSEIFDEGKKIEDAAKGNLAQLEKARSLYQKALDTGRLQNAEAPCLARLNDLTAKLILDPKAACGEPKAEFHKVEAGEVVDKIARHFKVTQGQIKRLNHLNDKLAVRVGQPLKILPGETLFKVDKEKLTGTLYIDGVFIKRYPVGIGAGNATPKGTFTVENKLINPDWFYEGKKVPYGDAKNILGTRWMGMANTAGGANGAGLGVHGTALPESVPGRESKGCVRMHNEDVEELYDYMPQGGKVVIE